MARFARYGYHCCRYWGFAAVTPPIRIGAGAGFATDRIQPAVALAERGALDYLVFEALAERTLAAAHRRMQTGAGPGYNPLLKERFRAVLPACAEHGISVVTNMGGADPVSAVRETTALVDELGLDLTVCGVTGSDVSELIDACDQTTTAGTPVDMYRDRLIAATAYQGAGGIRTALTDGADIVLTGRVADVSLFVGPIQHELGWDVESTPDRLGQAVTLGHLLECAGQVTGGYFAAPDHPVKDLADLGFPIGTITADGRVKITKLSDTGGQVTPATVKEQLLYEIHDPARYVTPDGVLDLRSVAVDATGTDQVAVTGATVTGTPDTFRVNLGYHDGFTGCGTITYAGEGALTRAEQAGAIVRHRLQQRPEQYRELRVEYIGHDSAHGDHGQENTPYEVRLRVAGRTDEEAAAELIGREVSQLYTNGPRGGGGVRTTTEPVVGIASTLIPAALVRQQQAVVSGERTQ